LIRVATLGSTVPDRLPQERSFNVLYASNLTEDSSLSSEADSVAFASTHLSLVAQHSLVESLTADSHVVQCTVAVTVNALVAAQVVAGTAMVSVRGTIKRHRPHRNLHGDLEEHGVEAAQDKGAQGNGDGEDDGGLDEGKHGMHFGSSWW